MNSVPITSKQMRWLGAKFAAICAIVSCALFMITDIISWSGVELEVSIIFVVIITIGFISLFALPFVIIGGYILGWLLHKRQWNKQATVKATISGIAIASLTLIIIFIVGGYFQACIGSHGKCQDDLFGYIAQVTINDLTLTPLTKVGHIFVGRFFRALFFAAASGGITGWRLSQSEQ
jgi:hypothetical protein